MIEIYTDGSCIGNPGPGGYAAVITKNGKEIDRVAGKLKDTTNNQMELLGVIAALEKTSNVKGKVIVYSDSKYIVDAINKKWIDKWKLQGWTRGKKELKNRFLWLWLDNLIDKFNIQFKYVKGHSGNKWNELADDIATTYSASI